MDCFFSTRLISNAEEYCRKYCLEDLGPNGFWLPVTRKLRIDLQLLWQLGFGWDKELPEECAEIWRPNVRLLEKLHNVVVNRCFSDGGNLAYGTFIFLRRPTSSGI